MNNKLNFRRFGIMLDNSRNAVMKPSAIKHMIDMVSKMGYNTLMLYTEDTYEVDNQPYFGHLRGKYSKKELQDLDSYAKSKGMELIPCIQTLAHLNALMLWPCYKKISDCNDILCAGDESVYKLIEDIFSTLDQCFTSRVVNIGMDEAHFIGRGRYLDQHGLVDRFDILIKHLNRVANIAKKYNFELCMWGDMLFRLASGGEYYNEDAKIPPEINELIPDNVRLIYWDYYNKEKQHYDKYVKLHKEIREDIWFAGGAWMWSGFAPHNHFSIDASLAAITSCVEHNVDDVFITMWGDDGAECSKYSVLPTLFAASEFAKGNTDLDDISSKFKDMFDISFENFMLVDLPNTPNITNSVSNPDKYMFYNDCFMGLFDGNINEGDGQLYGECANKINHLRSNKDFGLLFDSMYHLCRVLEVKGEIGLKTREAYLNRDMDALNDLIVQYDMLLSRLDGFYNSYLKRWNSENKPHGFDVQDIRIGGLIQRIKHCKNVLIDYVNNRIDKIEELEEPVLDINCAGENLKKNTICYNSWKTSVTTNVI